MGSQTSLQNLAGFSETSPPKTSCKMSRSLHLNTWDFSGQIIATSHDLTPNGGLVRGIPLFQGNLGW